MTERRFPPPWTMEELNDACFVVRDANGQALSYIYYEEEPNRRSAAKLLTKDEARRIFFCGGPPSIAVLAAAVTAAPLAEDGRPPVV